MAELTRNATVSAIVVSIRLNFMASLIPRSERSIWRVCTSEECRYKLCGITVAPMIPIAIYRASPASKEGLNPEAISILVGCTINISAKNEAPTTKTMEIINNSIIRIPL